MDSAHSLAKNPIDEDFLKAANFTPVRNFGGRYSLGVDGFIEWTQSIT
jgi:hypothetical protein